MPEGLKSKKLNVITETIRGLIARPKSLKRVLNQGAMAEKKENRIGGNILWRSDWLPTEARDRTTGQKLYLKQNFVESGLKLSVLDGERESLKCRIEPFDGTAEEVLSSVYYAMKNYRVTSVTAKRDTQGPETLLHSELQISFYRKSVVLTT